MAEQEAGGISTKSYEEQDVMQSHDCRYPEGTWHKEGEERVFVCEQNGNEKNFKVLLVINIGQATRHTSGKIATC